MSEIPEESANVALLLNREITKRVGEAMLMLLDGTDAPLYHISVNENSEFDRWAVRDTIVTAVMEAITVPLQTLIRQEIVDAFSSDSNCTRVITSGDTISLQLTASTV